MAAVLALAACGSAGTTDNAERDPSGRIVGAGAVGTNALQVGDCFLEPPEGTVLVVDAVPCAEPHAGQVVGVVEADDVDDWPGTGALAAQATDRCLRAVRTAGVAITEPGLGLQGWVPDEGSWDEGDRRIVCWIGRSDGSRLTGDLLADGADA